MFNERMQKLEAARTQIDRLLAPHQGATLAFAGLGIATVPPLMSMAISTWGWRMAFAVIGLAPLLATLPIAIFILRQSRNGLTRKPTDFHFARQ
jgi:hypothetical protein